MITKEILFNGVLVGTHQSTGDYKKDAEYVHFFLKEIGLVQTVSLSDQIFRQANSFAKVANAIYDNDLKKSPYNGHSICPFVVNATFSIELYLKAIHDFYGRKIRGHHLANLYSKLPNNGKLHYLNAAKDIRSKYELAKDTDISSCLESLSYTFENWRYIYEHNHLETELQSIRYTLHVSFEASCRVRDEKIADKSM
jgi:hypothetical protein